MLNRIHRLEISLAAKCQLLFGAAVVLIITAALFVPWQRMEQLTEQLNTTSASAVADSAVRQHVATSKAPASSPIRTPEPSRSIRVNGRDSFAPRLMSLTPTPDT